MGRSVSRPFAGVKIWPFEDPVSSQSNPILRAHWGDTTLEGDTYVTKVTARPATVAIALPVHFWDVNPSGCRCTIGGKLRCVS